MLRDRGNRTAALSLEEDGEVALFAAYLDSPHVLPFAGDRYIVQKPWDARRRLYVPALQFNLHGFRPGDARFEEGFGVYRVLFDRPRATITIDNIDTHLSGSFSGVGRELVRRTVLYAAHNSYRFVETTPFLFGAGSFWYGLGFLPLLPVVPHWHRTSEACDIESWAYRMARSPSAVWAFALTDDGRKALAEDKNMGVIDLERPCQRRYAALRMRLPSGIFDPL